MTEILILDYNRPEELKNLLESIKQNAKFEKDVVVLNNGGERYADQYKEQGLCDRVIHFDRGVGCGFGTAHLFAQCKTEYAFYVQVDHVLAYELKESDIRFFIKRIENDDYFYVDVAGDQGNGKFSERASFFRVEDYNKIPKTCGGPGCWDHIKWSEECVQDYMGSRNLDFYSFTQSAWTGDRMLKLPPFVDVGKWSVRENPDSSRWIHRTDTKVVRCLVKPTEVYSYPPFSDEQWKMAIEGAYPEAGIVPDGWKDNVFNVWE